MGEKIDTIAQGKILDNRVEIELNGSVTGNGDLQVHIQSDKFRFELDRSDFIKYGLTVLHAEKNLKALKGIK
jgi:hypothetical protein